MKVYIDDITSYSKSDFQKMIHEIKLYKKNQIFLYLHKQDQYLSILGEYLLIKGLHELGIDYSKCIFEVNENGKTFLTNYPYYYNISHFGTKVVCVIHSSPVGIDIIDSSKNISLHFFSCANEKKDFQKSPHLLLALKEAYLKMKGWNFSQVLDVSFSHQNSVLSCSDKNTLFHVLSLNNSYTIVICEAIQSNL